MSFENLCLAQPLLRVLEAEGYHTPTPIQARAIPEILAGRDVLGSAQTGTGKTAAFALPILHRLISSPVDKTRRGPALARVLVLSPTRELAVQIAEAFATYGRETPVSGTVIYGGVGQGAQVRDLRRGVDVIVATPGRLMDLMDQGHVHLGGIEMLVLDEADRMLDMGFIQPIREIASQTPEERQTLLFSATVSEPIAKLSQSLMRSPVRVRVQPEPERARAIEQSLIMVNRHDKPALLRHMLAEPGATRVVVFTKTKFGAERVGEGLERSGVSAATIHGNKAQNARKRALDAFRAGRARVLVATDVAARGIDVDDVSHVINYDLPMEPEAYMHRIGRTGRAGATGIAVSFCAADERGLLRDIEKLLGGRIPARPAPAFEREARPDPRPAMTMRGAMARDDAHVPARRPAPPHHASAPRHAAAAHHDERHVRPGAQALRPQAPRHTPEARPAPRPERGPVPQRGPADRSARGQGFRPARPAPRSAAGRGK